LIAITDSHNVMDGIAGGGSALHWMVQRPDGKLVDVDGAHDSEDILDSYHDEADDGIAAIGLSNLEHVREWYIECQGEPVPIRLARTFVRAVLYESAVSAVELDDELTM